MGAWRGLEEEEEEEEGGLGGTGFEAAELDPVAFFEVAGGDDGGDGVAFWSGRHFLQKFVSIYEVERVASEEGLKVDAAKI